VNTGVRLARLPPRLLRRLWLLVALALAALTSLGARTARADEGIDRLPADVFRAGHPGRQDSVYHGVRHSLSVQSVVDELAKARALSDEERLFLRQVAILHDWDPDREPGTPPRVPSTLQALRDDFSGARPIAGLGGSFLKRGFGWDNLKLKMALAIIQRTEFPFSGDHPNPAYRGTSPVDQYESMVRDLPPEAMFGGVTARTFVLREAPLLSEYGDKMSTYSARSFSASLRAVHMLAREKNRDEGPRRYSAPRLGTETFLEFLGVPSAYAKDRWVARNLRMSMPAIPDRREVLALLPQHAEVLRANTSGFQAYRHSLNNGATAKEAARVGAAAAAEAHLPASARPTAQPAAFLRR
jgi:hypothetical protein